MLDYPTLISIFRTTAQRHQGENQIKAFAVVHDLASQLNLENFGKTIEHAKYGSYWTRDGVTEDNDCKDYPALLMMRRSTDINDTTSVDDVVFAIALPFDKECDIREQKDIIATELMQDVIDYLRQFISAKDTNGKFIWIAHDQTLPTGYSLTGNALDYILQNRGSIQIGTNYVGVDSLVVKSASFRIQLCRTNKSTWGDYADTNTYTTTNICDGCF